MTSGGEVYLAIILAAFVTYAATLFWAMLTSSKADPMRDDGGHAQPHH